MNENNYSTPVQFCEKYPAFKIGGLRAQIFNEHKNGLAASGAIYSDWAQDFDKRAKIFFVD